MNKNEFVNIKIPNDIDQYIDKGIEKALKEIKSKNKKKLKTFITSIAAVVCSIIVLGITNPVFATNIPIIGKVFEVIEQNIYFPGNYSQYATAINETVTDNGIKVTLSEVLCDGENLYVTYLIKSEKPFKYTSWDDTPLTMNQLLTKESYKKVSFSNEPLDNTGFSGLEGKFIDENTFVGMETYYLSSLKTDVPDSFDFKVKLKSIGTGALKEKEKDQVFKGTWAFQVPVKVDKSINKKINIEYEENGAILNSISITPFQLVVNTTNPTNSHYGIMVVDDKNNEMKNDNSKLELNNQVSYFGGINKEAKSLKVIIYRDIVEMQETITHADGSSETLSNYKGREVILEKVIDIK